MRDPDPRTVQRARRGDLLAFEDLVREFQADAFRFAWHLTRDRQLAEDVTQEAFLRAFRFLGGSAGTGSSGRGCSASCGTARWTPSAASGGPMRRGRTRCASRSVADPTARAELEAALRVVSTEHREAFLLVEVFGLSYQETADVLGVAVGTVKSRMFRARQALCLAIADEEEAT